MDKTTLNQLKQKLEKEKQSLEETLKTFAKEDTKPRGDWDTRYPKFDSGNLDLASEADELQEYENLLPVEYSLELKLRDVNLALGKMKMEQSRPCRGSSMKSGYGACEKCGKTIGENRLNVCPEARLCEKCK